MQKYLYLTEIEWIDAWINGGSIPISLASTYLHDERGGNLTPDENLVHESPVDLKSLSPFIHIADGANVKNLNITNSSMNGQRIPDIVGANYYTEDGLILSFCNSFSAEIAERMKKKACVKILNMEKMRRKIDKQLGCRGIMGACKYTSDHNRNHFLKSADDSWQDEYRIFWRTTREKWIAIPTGTAELVSVFK